MAATGATPAEATPGSISAAGFRRRAWWVAGVTALLSIAALVVGGVIQFGGGVRSSDVEIPPTTGLSVEVATTQLEELGLVVAVEPLPESSVEIPRDAVIRTDPGEGEQVPRRSEVVLVISSGPAAVTVPELEGLTLTAALLALEEAGLTAGNLNEQDSAQPEARVLSSTPEFGQVLNEGEAVSLDIASGSNVVPRVVGFTRSRANQLLVERGFQVAVETVPASEPQGTVIEVRPAAGVTQRVGTSITLVVSQAGQGAAGTGADTGNAPTPTDTASQTATVTVTETLGSSTSGG